MSAQNPHAPYRATGSNTPPHLLGRALLDSLQLHDALTQRESDAIRQRDMKLVESILAEKRKSNENLERLWGELRATVGDESLSSAIQNFCPDIHALVKRLRRRNSVNGQLVRCSLDTTTKALDILRGRDEDDATYAFPSSTRASATPYGRARPPNNRT